ncbi:hypothetical protein NDN08_004746 [Rhodosorus marinus]|uniref:DUF2428 domain-containing protein n=1 Tax=Rhodosorus marinus TaxID=101924 RepID=A0AAV8UMH1_9RHOD|nr:hypothetical protein NDN08_004746 [Rhodosorus marinus]
MGGLNRILRRQPVGSRLVLVSGADEILEEVRSLDDGVYRILVSLKDAENQKSQSSALKLLGGVLRERLEKNHNDPVIDSIVKFLLIVLFEVQDAPFAVRDSALQGAVPALRAGNASEWVKFYRETLRRISEGDLPVTRFGGFIQGTNLAFADGKTRNLLYHEDGCYKSISLLCEFICSEYGKQQDGDESIFSNVPVAEADAIESSTLKLLQDILQVRYEGRCPEPIDDDLQRAADSVKNLLKGNRLPRGLTMPAAMSIVTAVCSFSDAPEDAVIKLKSLYQSSDCATYAFSKMALCRAIAEAPAAREPSIPLLYSPGGVFETLCGLSQEPDPHLNSLAFESVLNLLRRGDGSEFNGGLRDSCVSLIIDKQKDRNASLALYELVSMTREDLTYWEETGRKFIAMDWRRSGKYLLLSSLLPFLGAKGLLELEPDAQLRTVSAINSNQTVTKVGCDFLRQLWKQLKQEVEDEEFYELTAQLVVYGLAFPDHSTRESFTEVALPMYIKLCKKAAVVNIERVATSLLSEKRKRKHLSVSHSVDRTAWRPDTEGLSFNEIQEQGLLNAVVSAMSASRRLVGSSGAGEDSSTALNIVEEALKCSDILVRIAAFEYIVAGQALTEPYSKKDMRLIKHAIALLFMPDGRPAQRSKIRHILRDLWARLTCSRETALTATAWWERQRKVADKDGSRDQFEKLRAEYIDESGLLIQYLFLFTAKGCYPGASHKRRLASLLTIAQAKRGASGDQDGLLSDLRRVIGALELGVVDDWDRNRAAAYEAMLAFSDLNGHEEPEANGHRKAQFLSGVSKHIRSARLREADTGALLWRRFFNQLSKGGRQCLFASTPSERNDEFSFKGLENACAAQLSFIGNLLNSMAYMTQRANDDLGAACEMGLVHGYALTLRYVLQDISFEAFSERSDLRATITVIIAQCSLALEVSMKGVGFHEPNVNAHQNDSSEDADERQKFITGCFLSVSEVCNALGILVHRAPLTDEAEDHREGLLDSSQINTIAALFDNVLRNTRHTGVIDKASDALKTIASRLVRSSSPNLRELPPEWLASTLASATRGDLYVLRRSAGTPFYILAVLGAERKKGNRHFLPETVRQLLETSRGTGLDGLELESAQAAVSHSMNVLRVLFTDGSLAESMLPYVGDAFAAIIPKFSDESWLIRNSATMLYGALLRRSVGHGTAQPLGRVAGIGVSGREFFSRYSGLFEVILVELERVSSNLETCEWSPETEKRQLSTASLFPMLCLLSSFQPSVDEDPSDALSTTRLYPSLRKCLASSDEAIRRIAADAIVSVVDPFLSNKINIEAMSLLRAIESKDHTEQALVDFRWSSKKSGKVQVVGSFDGYGTKHELTEPDSAGAVKVSLWITPGRYLYNYVVNEELVADPSEIIVQDGEVKRNALTVRAECRKISGVEERKSANTIHGLVVAAWKLLETELIQSDYEAHTAVRILQAITSCRRVETLSEFRQKDERLLLGNPLIMNAYIDLLIVGLKALRIVSDSVLAVTPTMNSLGDHACDILETLMRASGVEDSEAHTPRTLEQLEVSIIFKKSLQLLKFLPESSIARLEKLIRDPQYRASEKQRFACVKLMRRYLPIALRANTHNEMETVPAPPIELESNETEDVELTGNEDFETFCCKFSMQIITLDDDYELLSETNQLLLEILSQVPRLNLSMHPTALLFCTSEALSKSRTLEERELSVQLVGHVLGHYRRANWKFASKYEVDLIKVLELFAEPSQPTPLRVAVCRSIIAMRTEDGFERGDDCRMLLVLLSLIQDDEDDVRMEAMRALGSNSDVLSTLLKSYGYLFETFKDRSEVLGHVEKELSLNIDLNGQTHPLLQLVSGDRMVDWSGACVSESSGSRLEKIRSAIGIQTQTDDTRIFEEELDNMYFEKILGVQVILQSYASRSSAELEAKRLSLNDVALVFLRQLRDGLDDVKQSDDRHETLLGAARLPAVFESLFVFIVQSALVLLMQERRASEDVQSLVSDITSLASEMDLHLALQDALKGLRRIASTASWTNRKRHIGDVCFLIPTDDPRAG